METDMQSVFDLLYVASHVFAAFKGWQFGGTR